MTSKHHEVRTSKCRPCNYCEFKSGQRNVLIGYLMAKYPESAEAKGSSGHACRHCDYKSGQRNGLRMHQITKHLTSEEAKTLQGHACRYCEFKSGQRNVLIGHLIAKHPESEEVKGALAGPRLPILRLQVRPKERAEDASDLEAPKL